MLASLQSLAPIFAYFLIGVLLRSAGIASREHAQFLLRVVFYVTLPALAFTAISSSELTRGSLALPAMAFLVNSLCTLAGIAYARLARLPRSVAGSVVIGAGLANVTFTIPFIAAGLGSDALAAAILYDAGNAVFVATGSYLVASRYGKTIASSTLGSLGKMMRTPLLLAIVAAVVTSIMSWEVPALIESAVGPLGATTSPLVLIALGASFSAAGLRSLSVYNTVAIRMLGGLLLGIVLVNVLGLHGGAAVAVIAAAAAPIGFNAVTLAAIGKLDAEHATASLFVSVMIGLVTITAIILAGSRWFQV